MTIVWRILGIALLVLGVQGAIRLLADNSDSGLLSWVPGGFTAHIACYVAAAVGGLLLAGRAGRRQPE